MSAIPQTPPELSSAATSLDRRIQMLRTAMGPVIAAALADPDVVEIMLNPDRTLWVDRLSSGRMPLGVELSQDDGERIIRLVAAHVGAEVHRGRPLLTAELPETGERFEGILPPAAPGPAFALRKRAVSIIGLDRYVADGILTTGQAEFLRRAVRERQNILIAGATSSGKTTLANALLAEIAATGDRVLVLEDTIELQCAARDHVPLRTRAGVVSMTELVRATMRLRPDRVIVGEVRGGEALDLVKVWGTGHPGGIATIHAGSALGALLRLEQLILEVAVNPPRALIAEAVNVVIHIAGRGRKRRVESIARVVGFDGTGYRLADALETPFPELMPVPLSADTAAGRPEEGGHLYSRQVMEASQLVAEKLGFPPERFDVVWQSRSGPPQVPWLEPDICDHVTELHGDDVPAVLVCPIGFLCDHVEVVWDLDTELAEEAEEFDMVIHRINTIGLEDSFISMLGALIAEYLEGEEAQRLGELPQHGCNTNGRPCYSDCCVMPKRPTTRK